MQTLLLLPALFLPLPSASGPSEVVVVRVDLPEPGPCLTPEEWDETRAAAERNLAELSARSLLPPGAPSRSVLFEWPLRAANGLDDFGYHVISGFPDLEDVVPGGLLDYECGQRTYDGHNGTDSVLWPFWWYKMDHDQVEIVAAAAGVIFDKADGYDDRSCTAGGSSNKVAIRHADGTMAWYLHMKKWSVTTKLVGESVAVGEYLGIVASSGHSGLPHLHFDLRDENWVTFDPHEGPCNDLVGGSRWVDQRPYYDCAVNAVYTHSAPPVFPLCPQQEIPNFRNRFAAGDTVYYAIYHRDLLFGQVAHYAILRPDGSTADEGDYGIDDPHYAACYALVSYPLPPGAPGGTWTVGVDYEGRHYEHEFVVSPEATDAIRRASATFRNVGSNPASYDAVTPPVLGTTYRGTVDLAGTTGHALAVLVGYSTPVTFPLSGGQTLLVNIGDPAGELLGQLPLSGPVATYHIPLPPDAALVGFEAFTQALHLGGIQPFALSNAQDLFLGY